ncbi:hypothetical protein BDK51DRAFT_35323, partial [Blyttiomyces helicus]
MIVSRHADWSVHKWFKTFSLFLKVFVVPGLVQYGGFKVLSERACPTWERRWGPVAVSSPISICSGVQQSFRARGQETGRKEVKLELSLECKDGVKTVSTEGSENRGQMCRVPHAGIIPKSWKCEHLSVSSSVAWVMDLSMLGWSWSQGWIAASHIFPPPGHPQIHPAAPVCKPSPKKRRLESPTSRIINDQHEKKLTPYLHEHSGNDSLDGLVPRSLLSLTPVQTTSVIPAVAPQLRHPSQSAWEELVSKAEFVTKIIIKDPTAPVPLPNFYWYEGLIYVDSPDPLPEALAHCDCTTGCQLDGKCGCINFLDGGLHAPYTQWGLATGSKHRGVISECNVACPCGVDCGNRVVQKGRQVPLHLVHFGVEGKGWGVVTPGRLPKGKFVSM